MKSQKGITMVSLIIYVMSFLAICGVVAVITTFFHNNTQVFSNEATASSEYDMLNAYLVKEIKQEENLATAESVNKLVFENGNEYIFTNIGEEEYKEIIFRNEEKGKYFILCNYVKNFAVKVEENKIEIAITILDKTYNQTYTIEQ